MNSIDIFVPDLPESVVNATVVAWHKKPGDVVARDEVLVEIETDKVILEVPASSDGILDIVLEGEGAIVTSHQILGYLRKGNNADIDNRECSAKFKDKAPMLIQHQQVSLEKQSNNDALNQQVMDRLVDLNLNSTFAQGISNIDDCLTCEKDIDNHLSKSKTLSNIKAKSSITQPARQPQSGVRSEKRVQMTSLRKRTAERLLEAKNSTAMLTTFNEVNMKIIMDLRKQYGEVFEKRHGIRLGFMSFYMKAAVEALKRYPEVNAYIDDDDIVYHNYFDVSIAVSTRRGLVTPILRNVDTLSMADIESKIRDLVVKGRDGKLTVDDLVGGNFTITNGGTFGSLISTPIINPPQSAILGIHAIKDRPMAVGGKVEILPMMYLALSYDHRLIDGRESVGFLLIIKELLEDPTRLLLDV